MRYLKKYRHIQGWQKVSNNGGLQQNCKLEKWRGHLFSKKSGGYRPPATLTPILSRSNKRLSCLIRNFMVGNLFDRFLGWRLDP